MPFSRVANLAQYVRPRRILMVDTEDTCNALVSPLTSRGYLVTCRHDGKQALTAFNEGYFDLVLTDIELPSLDGMQLLTTIKEVNPRVPVIIISGQGDVQTVVDSLKNGAENFLTKPLQEDVLLKVIEQALAISYSRLGINVFEGQARQVTYLKSPSSPEAIKEIIFLVAQSAVTINYAENDLDNNIKLALVEAITNAMEHGHSWDAVKLVEVTIDINPDELKVMVCDQGPGFNVKAQPDPTDPERLLLERGRGVFLMRAIMDEVQFNDKGNCVELIKRRAEKRPEQAE